MISIIRKARLCSFRKYFQLKKISIAVILIVSFNTSFAQSYTATTCSGTAVNFNEPGAVVGETYTWSAPIISPAGAIPNGTALSGQSSVAQTLTNNTTSPATATYTVTTSVSTSFQLVITVNPVPSVANLSSTICSGSAFNIIPSNVPSNTKYTWTAPAVSPVGAVIASAQATPQIFIGQTLTNPTTSQATVTYTVTPAAGSCTGNSFLVTVPVNPLPVLNNSNVAQAAMCSGTAFSYGPTSSTSGTSINWSRTAFTGISNTANQGANNPNEVLINTTTSAINVNYVFTLSANSCSNNQTITVAVNPKPTLTSSFNPPSICSGNPFNYTPAASTTSSPTYTWSRAAVTGISATAGSGSGNNLSEILVNTTNQAKTVTYVYTVTDGLTSCVSASQLVNVVVNPTPNIADLPVSSCSGNTFIAAPNNAPTGTLYTWATPIFVSGGVVTGGSAVTVGQFYVGQALTNNGTQGVVDYTVTPSTNGCIGTNFHVVVTVTGAGTTAVLNNLTPPAICSGATFNYTPASSSAGVTYAWTRYFTNGITLATGTGSGNPQEALTNSSSVPLVAHYGYTLTTPDGCTNTQQVTVTVNPVTSLSSTLSPLPVCSNAVFSYTPLSNTAGTLFSWQRAAVAGISNASASGTNNPNETLINTTTSAVTVSYIYTLTPPSGCVNTQTVNVSVSPSPVLSSSLTPAAICSGAIFTYAPTSNTSSITFNWSRAVVASISNGAGSGVGNPAEILVNTSNSAVTVPYVYTLTANGCTNNQTVNVVVNPAPNIANQTAVSCSNSSFTVTPANVPAGTQYTWSNPAISPAGSVGGGSAQPVLQSSISQFLNNSTTSLGTATYTVTPAANGCVGATFTLAVTVNSITTLSSSVNPAAICSNTAFNYTPTSTTVGTTFSWSRAVVNGISNPVASGTNNPNETLINTLSTAVSVTYSYALNTPNGCVNTQSVIVSVYPLPVLSSASPGAICSGATFNYVPTSAVAGSVFTWSRAVTPFISNGAGSGTGNPAEVLVNTGINTIIVPYVYSITANGCTNTQTVNVSVNPTPSVGSQVASACNSAAFTVSPTNVPANTTYTWGLPTYNPVFSVTGGSAQAIPQNNITQTLNNSTNSPAQATYTVTPAANGCTGTSFTLLVTVNTTTVLSSSLVAPAVCSNTVFSYTPASNTPGTSFSWTRSATTGISNPAASGINNPNETLINITSQAVSVSYTYALNTPNGCVNIQTVTVSVSPAPVLSSTLTPAAICSGSTFNYTPASASAGAAFSWNRSVLPSISNGPGAGSGLINPSEVLVNTTINPVSVPYNYTITANGCTNTQIVSVTVNPTPNTVNQTTTICGNTIFNVSPVNMPAGTQYTWSLPGVNPSGSINGVAPESVPQNSVSQLVSNQTLNSGVATYTVTPVANGCTGASFTVAVTVKPTPVIPNQLLTPVCSGTAFSYSSASVPTVTTYTWSNPLSGPVNSLSGGSGQPISQPIISQTLNSTNNLTDTATYTVVPSTAGCAGNIFTLAVPVKPVPFINNMTDTICTGSAFTIVPGPVPANTTYTWPTPVSVPFGTTIGRQAQSIPGSTISQSLFVTGTAIAQVVYTITPSAAGCIGPDFTLVETVGVPLAPVANSSAVICSGTAFNLTPTTVPPNTTYTWITPVATIPGSVTGGSAKSSRQTIVGQTLANTTSATATIVYRVVPFNTGCSGSPFTATVNVSPVPKATITGKPVVCRDPFDTLSVSFVGTAPWSFSYLDNNVPHTQTGITTSPYTWILPSLPVVPTRKLEITYVNDLACVDSTDTAVFVQKVNPLPIGQIKSLHGTYICNNIPDTLWVIYPPTDTLLYQWTRNRVPIPGATTDSISTLLGGNYNAVLTNQYGCVDTASPPATLIVIAKPKLNFSFDSYCINIPIHFTNLTDTTYIGATQWLWDLGDSTTSSTFHTTDIYPKAGSRHIKLTATQLYCQAYATSIDTTINVQFPIAAVRMPSVSAYKGVSKPIAVRSIPGYRYLWTPTRGIDFPDSASVNFNYQVTQDYYVNLISPAGCVTQDSVLVRVFDDKMVDILVPKSFTPNGDGINDILYPYLAGIKTFQYFKVYNRFGKLLFETNNPDVGWNGNLNGTPQPMAIYIWVSTGIAADGSLVQKTGETLLLR